jgi:hypothetical protein
VAATGCSGPSSPNSAPSDRTDPKKDTPPKKEYKTPASPKEAMVMVTEGLCDANEEQLFKALQTANEKEKEFVKALVRFIRNTRSFQTAFVKAYGEKAWERFNDPNIDPGHGEGNATLTVMDKKEGLDNIEKAEIKLAETNDSATCEITDKKGKKITWRMTKVADGWMVQASTFTAGTGADLDKTVKLFGTFADLLPKYQKAIGQKGITADDIDVELGKAMVKELFGLPTKPPRFDPDQFKD